MEKFIERKRKRDFPVAYSEAGLASNRPQPSLLETLNRQAAEASERAKVQAQNLHITPPIDEWNASAEQVRQGALFAAEDEADAGPTIRESCLYVEESTSGIIAKKTDELCLWDLQPIGDEIPFPVPVGLDALKRNICVLGYCCSVRCALAFVKSSEILRHPDNSAYKMIEQFAREYFGAKALQDKRIFSPAPPREKLSMLHAQFKRDGVDDPMKAAIHEFRKNDGDQFTLYHYQPPIPLVRVTRRIDEHIFNEAKENYHLQRLNLLAQQPKPIAATIRGRQEQRRYVLKKVSGQPVQTGAIDQLLGITFSRTPAIESDSSEDDCEE